eukprot:5824129-Amphidinium_carterae.1
MRQKTSKSNKSIKFNRQLLKAAPRAPTRVGLARNLKGSIPRSFEPTTEGSGVNGETATSIPRGHSG